MDFVSHKVKCIRFILKEGKKEDDATNKAEWRKKLISYTSDPR